MDAPNYVQGQYTVAQRDEIFTKAAKYPDAADGLQNQVPTIFPDGTIQWRQQGGGGDIANANLAPVETSTTASINYRTDDLLIYNGQLYRATGQIPSGATITPGANVVPVTIEDWVELICVPTVSRGENLLRNWFWLGGASGYGAFPINSRGAVWYNTAGYSIDGWYLASGSLYIYASGISLSTGTYLLQPVDNFAAYVGRPLTFTAWTSAGVYSGTAILSGTDGVQYVSNSKLLVYTDPSTHNGSLVINAVDSLMIYAVKLELGTHQTLIHVEESVAQLAGPLPDFWLETQRCLRSTADSGDAYSGLKWYYGTCSNAGGNCSVICPGFVLDAGAHVFVKFTQNHSVSVVSLNVNGTGAKSTNMGNNTSLWEAGDVIEFVYDGSIYCAVGVKLASPSQFGRVKLSDSIITSNGASKSLGASTAAVNKVRTGIGGDIFSSSTQYYVGDFVLQGSTFYRCKNNHLGAWANSDFESSSLWAGYIKPLIKYNDKLIHTKEVTISSIPSTALEFESNQVDTILSSELVIEQGANTDYIHGTGVVTAAGVTVRAQTYVSGGKGYCYVVAVDGTVNPTSAKMIIKYTLTSGN